MTDLALKALLIVCVVLAYELGYLRGRGGKARWLTPRERPAEVYCPALAADGERFPFAIPARGLWNREALSCSACGAALPSDSHPQEAQAAAARRRLTDRDSLRA